MKIAKNMMASLGALGAFLGFGVAPTLANYNRSRRPTGAALRNPADPAQAARIEAAAAKRERKAQALTKWALSSRWGNNAHKIRMRVPGGTYALFLPDTFKITR